MVCSLVAVFRVTRQLGGDEQQGWIASVFVATLPMGILQSTSTQNDYVATALLCCFVTLGLQLLKEPVVRSMAAVEMFAAGACAGMVKPSAYLLGGGFAVWFLISIARRLSITSFLKLGAMALITLAIVAGPFATRNFRAYGSLLSNYSRITINGSFGAKQTLDNLIRDVVSNLVSGQPRFDDFVGRATLKATAILNLDIHRSETTFPADFVFAPTRDTTHEDTAPNPLHTILILSALTVAVSRWRLELSSRVLYWGAWLVGLVLFAAVLRWQPWIVRLELPAFVLAGPCAALLWPSWRPGKLQQATMLMVVCCGALPALLFNYMHPLLSRGNRASYLSQDAVQSLFASRPELANAYVELIDKILQSKAREIGLITEANDWEYPIWRMLRDRNIDYPIRIEHVKLVNVADQKELYEPAGQAAASWPLGAFTPEVVVWTPHTQDAASSGRIVVLKDRNNPFNQKN